MIAPWKATAKGAPRASTITPWSACDATVPRSSARGAGACTHSRMAIEIFLRVGHGSFYAVGSGGFTHAPTNVFPACTRECFTRENTKEGNDT